MFTRRNVRPELYYVDMGHNSINSIFFFFEKSIADLSNRTTKF